MEEMIDAEIGLPSAIAAHASDAAGELARAVRDAHARGAEIVVTGCGTSEHAAHGIAALLGEALDGRVAVRQALEAASEPQRDGLCIGVSHEGETAATAASLAAARAAGAATALVTAVPTASAAAHADVVLATPLVDRSWCHTVGYVSPLLAGALVAGALAGDPFDAVALERYLVEARTAVDASALAGVRRLLAAGSGLDEIGSRELALKVAEGARIASTALSLETVVHGHLVAHDAGSALVVLVTDEGGSLPARRAAAVLAAADRIGLTTAAVVAPTVAGLPVRVRIDLPDRGSVPPALARLLGGAIALQELTLALARARRVNPDFLRREEEPYREAAALAERFPA
jgi:fructoselysine-6-P-deglycase FrlB-like protein